MFYTDRLMLRSFDEQADLPIILQLLNDVEFLQALSADAKRPASRTAAVDFVKARMNAGNGLPSFILCDKPTADQRPETLGVEQDLFAEYGKPRYPLVGLLNLNQTGFSFTNRTIRLGIFLDGKHQDRGLGTEVLAWACEYMFNDLGLHRCELTVAAANTRAWKCYSKVGFIEEGRQREAYFDRGVWKDHVLMAMLEKDWREKQAKPAS